MSSNDSCLDALSVSTKMSANDVSTNCDNIAVNSSNESEVQTIDAEIVSTSVSDNQYSMACDNQSKHSPKRSLDSLDKNDVNYVPIKRHKTDDNEITPDTIIIYLEKEQKRIQELFLEHILELFYLEHGGNIMDFQMWRKKSPNDNLLQYLRVNAVESDDELKELIDFKTAIDYSSKVVSDSLSSSEQVLRESTSSSCSSVSVVETTALQSLESVCVASLAHTAHATHAAHTTTSPNTSTITSTTCTPIVISTAPKLGTTSTITTSSTRTSSSTTGVMPAARHTTRQHSISSVYDSAIGSQEQIVERAKQEAYVMQRIAELRKNGLWSSRRLPKVQEPARSKVHWDYLLEEMAWLAADFAQERKWKKAAAKKCSRMIIKYHHDKHCHAEKAEREEFLRMRKIASNIAKQVKSFWSDIEKVVEAKQEVKLKEKRKKLHDMHLNFIVDKADKYTEKLTQKLGKSVINSEDSGLESHISQNEELDDNEFEPGNSGSDDEETIAKEEEEVGVGDVKKEIEILQKESEIPIEDLKASLPQEIFDSPSKSLVDIESDKLDTEFIVDEQSVPDFDDEETIEEQEELEGKVDYSTELNELENEANIPIEELIKKYSKESNDLDSDDDECDDGEGNDEFDELNDDNSIDNEESTEDEDEMSTEEENSQIGMEFLIGSEIKNEKPLIEEINDEKSVTKVSSSVGPNKEIADIAAGAESLQPKGNTLSTVNVCTKVPFLLKHTLREYQHIGLDWLVAMHDKKLNGILADEMGLGKTIQTIALLAHLACEQGVWGPHLIVVPTSVMLNWEMEFKKWCPAFKILTYYGSPKERKQKRQGWTKPNQFHVCITSYKLVIQDHQSFRRKKWRYFILDEAQHIKNFKSQRWQMLLNFNTSRRLLLTGTPLQNNLMELWSLMHFLMPNVFQSHKEFKDWFVNPVTGMLEGSHEKNEELIRRLHKVLRPFLLRRLKCNVEKQLPQKYEHVIMCRLSKRQRFLYEEFMSLGKTKETLATGNFLSVINILMQLRKVCNHPNLFDPRPTISPFMTEAITYTTASLVTSALDYDPFKHINLKTLNLQLSDLSFTLSAFAHHRIARFMSSPELIQEIDSAPEPAPRCPSGKIRLQIRTSSMHSSSVGSPTNSNPPTSSTTLTPNVTRLNEQRFLIAHNSSLQCSPQRLSTTAIATSSTDGNRVAIPLCGRVLQTPAGQHILLRTSPGNPISSTIATPATTTTILRQNQAPLSSQMRQIIVTRSVQSVGIANSHEQNLICAQLPNSSRITSSPFVKTSLIAKQQLERKEKLKFLARINTQRCSATALYASDLIEVATISNSPAFLSHRIPERTSIYNTGNGRLNCNLAAIANKFRRNMWCFTHSLTDMIKTPETVAAEMNDLLSRYVCIVPRVVSPQIQLHASHIPPSKRICLENLSSDLNSHVFDKFTVLNTVTSNMRTQFPELRLIQYDCGKLQTLDKLLWELKTGGHRVLIFTQMSRMLDIFEQFLNYHGHTYLRLDGTTKVEQRQALMERYNADKRIFCFILSTRSGGIGVNLTGADTVIFYDSDWNPTMDAQAQDRCHRIGQTRDVHIYRLISEMTVEENILQKAKQKKLLGDVAIEGGNFTTAFFKKNAIQELFGIELKAELQMLTSVESCNYDNTNDVIADTQLEQALCTAEEDNDVAAVNTARAEAAAEFAEFDENIPIDNEVINEEKSAEEEKIDELIEQLKPIEKYAMNLLETFQESSSFEQLKQAEEEIEAQRLIHKKEWEMGRLQTEKEEKERAKALLEEQREPILTCHREDAYNQVFLSYNGLEQMPIWAPPTPPQDDNDLYIDYSMGFLYEHSVMPESQLPPVYVPKETNKRLRLDTTIARKQKVRKEEGFNIPRSLFDRPSTAIVKLRRELILQKLKGSLTNGSETAAIHRTLNTLGANCAAFTQSPILPSQALIKSQMFIGSIPPESLPNWAIHEDWAVLQVIQYFQDLPLNLLILSPGHIPNWDLVSDVVNSISCNYRSPKLCKYHYEMAIVPREEGKVMYETASKQKQKKVKGINSGQTPPINVTPVPSVSAKPNSRPMRTSHLYFQDSNVAFSQLSNQRFETIKQIANKRTPTLKPMFINPTGKNPKHIAILAENNINYDQPLTPIQVALNRAERISKEKQKVVAEQQLAASVRQQQMQLQVKQQVPQIKAILTPNTNIPAAQHQLQQAISAKVAALNQATLSKVVTTSGIVSNASSTTTTQLNLSKTLTQLSPISNQSQHSLPQPILSQINVSPAIASSSVTMPEGIQLSQQTCSVVSVATLTPQVHQKLIAAVAPVGQMANQPINRFTTQSQVYKQLLLRQHQQQQIQRQQNITSQHIQIQQVPQQSGKQITTVSLGQQQPRFQITATVTQQPIQHTQSLIATAAGLRASPPNIMSSLPVQVPVASTQQPRILSSNASKPTQQIITRTITDPLQIGQMTQIIKRQQQTAANLTLLQQTATHQQQSQSAQQSQQLLQNPVTFVKTLSSPVTIATQSLTIPVTMTGMSVFTSPTATAKGSTQTSSVSSTTTTIASVPAAQLRQIQLLQQKRTQQQPQVMQQQIQNVTQQLGQQNQGKLSAASLSTQPKGVTQLQASSVGTIQILQQPSQTCSQNVSTAKTMPTTVTVQQLQQVLKQGFPHNLPHTIHVSQSPVTSSGATLIPQSILQAVTQTKSQLDISHTAAQSHTAQTSSNSLAVNQIASTQASLKHIQVVASTNAVSQSQTVANVVPKSIIISGQPTILQTTALQHAVQSQPQTVTFAIRPISAPTQIQSQPATTRASGTSDVILAPVTQTQDTIQLKEEAIDNTQSQASQANQNSQHVRQSPYATRQRNNKS